jgi:hypothetical protein
LYELRISYSGNTDHLTAAFKPNKLVLMMEENDSSGDEFRLIGEKNWNKIKASSHSVSCARLIATYFIIMNCLLLFYVKQEGYRNGVEEGKERKVQVGFDQGYKDGFQQSQSSAEVKGFLSAIMLKENKTNPELHEKLKLLVDKI